MTTQTVMFPQASVNIKSNGPSRKIKKFRSLKVRETGWVAEGVSDRQSREARDTHSPDPMP